MFGFDRITGKRIYVSGDPNVWLVYHEQRHRIVSPEVYDALFSEIEGLVEFPALNEIPIGYELGVGTCLVQAEGEIARYLLVDTPEGVRRLHISTWNVWEIFSFSENSLQKVSPLLLKNVKEGACL
ncbi:hypothetical protein ABEV34_04415 [Methylorubrum rhodesianum]|uniref:hypothetical protein n=1 Tax=Methylorubrum TaxID=2282523 RepID=UPI00160F7406|nr:MULTISPECIES: hypothetical protein [Methylorubrum]MBB5765609.1 hypothetical protein [Methylorubrum rhodesianum]